MNEETMLYVHFASAHTRPLPPALLKLVEDEAEPTRRVLALLGGRCNTVTTATAEERNLA